MDSINSISISALGVSFLCGFLAKYVWKMVSSKPNSSKNLADNYKNYPGKDEIRLVMCVRGDLKMKPGKVAAQCGHAAVGAYVLCQQENPAVLRKWMSHGATKIALKINSEEELFELKKKAKQQKICTYVVQDAGQTQVEPGSRTVLAIGPAARTHIDTITGHLKLF